MTSLECFKPAKISVTPKEAPVCGGKPQLEMALDKCKKLISLLGLYSESQISW